MANLFQCDRCKSTDKVYYKSIRASERSNVKPTDIYKLFAVEANLTTALWAGTIGILYDLCEDCTDKVMEVLHNA
jgi:hypothetical protein